MYVVVLYVIVLFGGVNLAAVDGGAHDVAVLLCGCVW